MELEKSLSVVLISSGQPSLNPRLVKEADALFEAGYRVTVIFQYWNDWGNRMDEKLLPSKGWKAIRVGGSPTTERCAYWLSRLRFKLVSLLPFDWLPWSLKKLRLGRCTALLSGEAARHRADLYIGHNLAALPATVHAAKVHSAKCGFDAEDFHRNEVSDNPQNEDVRLKKAAEERYFPRLDYLSAASPLISREYQRLFPQLLPVTLLNVFPAEKLPAPNAPKAALKLFWFSQTIGPGRGLETVFEALEQTGDLAVELYLLGNCPAGARSYFERLAQEQRVAASRVHYIEPVPSDELITFASQFDVGLATESGTPFNREICLTNKIFTYIQAGLAVIASNTAAQAGLMSEHPDSGRLVNKNDAASLSAAIRFYASHTTELSQAKKQNAALGRSVFNWEKESERFLQLVGQTLSNKTPRSPNE